MKRIRQLKAWRPGRLARNVAHVGGWNAGRIALQAINLVLLARVFGPELYGALSGSVALYLTVAQFVGLGTGISLVRHVAKGGDADAKLRSIQRVYLLTGAGLCMLAWMAASWLYGHFLSASVLLMLAAAEIAVMPLVAPLACRFQAEERLGMTSALLAVAPVARCLAIVILFLLGIRDIRWYAAIYLSGMALAISTLLYVLWPRSIAGNARLPGIASEVRQGLTYVVSSATVTANSELDKAVMLRLAGELATGHYAAASRIAQAALMPVQALLVAIAPRWFRNHGQESSRGSMLLAIGIAGIYSIGAATACWIMAPLLPMVLGPEFYASIPLLQLFTAAIVSGSLRQTMMTAAMTSDLQSSRNIIELTSLGFSLLLMAALIPRHGGSGAVLSIVVGDTFAIGLGAAALLRQRRRQLPTSRAPGAATISSVDKHRPTMAINQQPLYDDLLQTGTEIRDDCILGCRSEVRRDPKWERWLLLPPRYGVLRCLGCGVRWLSPRPDGSGLAVIYSSRHYFHSGGTTDFAQYARQREEHFRTRISQLKERGVRSVLDYGAATGGFVAAAIESGLDATGVEFSEAAREEAMKLHGITLLSPDEAARNDWSFDAVHMNHVLEHMPDPVTHLQWCARQLRSGGTLIIEVPNQFRNDADRLRRLVGKGGRQQSFDAFSLHHTCFFDPHNLRRACALAGFDVTEVRTLITRNPNIDSRARRFLERLLAWSARTRHGGDSIELLAVKPGNSFN